MIPIRSNATPSTNGSKLDPALPFLAVPIALAALFVRRLRPFAVGLVILIAMVLRPGYLPVPFILAALPLTALLAAGTGEVALRLCSAPLSAIGWPAALPCSGAGRRGADRVHHRVPLAAHISRLDGVRR